MTVHAWNFRPLASVPEGLFQPGSAELWAHLLVGRGSCPRPQLLRVLRLQRRTWPLREGRRGREKASRSGFVRCQVFWGLFLFSFLLPTTASATLVYFCSRQLILILRSSSSSRSPPPSTTVNLRASALLPCPELEGSHLNLYWFHSRLLYLSHFSIPRICLDFFWEKSSHILPSSKLLECVNYDIILLWSFYSALFVESSVYI